MSNFKKSYISQYGKISIPREKCPECGEFSFVIDNVIQCFGILLKKTLKVEGVKMECAASDTRFIPKKIKEYILKLQQHCCAYCDMPFGFIVYRKGKRIKLKIHYDHFVPFDYCRDSSKTNIIASCQVCNSLKSCMVFNTIDECRIYLQHKREQKGYNF